MGYRFDIFVSYPRSGQVRSWVHNHFLPVLGDCLDAHLPDEPRIFVDTEQPTGVEWPEHIREALLKSRLLIAVWTPPYFRSQWCLAEWISMLEREQVLAQGGCKLDRGLIYPVIYSDGKHFDERAQNTQYRKDLSKYTYPYDCFRDSTAYLEFHDAMMSISQEIEAHLNDVPDWQPDWPVATPQPPPASTVNLISI